MKRNKSTLKSYFETGDKPSQSQYENLIDSLRHVDDKIPLSDLQEEAATKSWTSENYLPLSGGTISGQTTFEGEINAKSRLWAGNISTITDTIQGSVYGMVSSNASTQFAINADNDSLAVLAFGDKEDFNAGAITYDNNDDTLKFRTSGISDVATLSTNKLSVAGTIEASSGNTDGSEVLRLNLDGGRDWVYKQKGTGSGTALEFRSTQHKDYHQYATASIFRNSVDDTSHLVLNHQSKTAELTGTLEASGAITANNGIFIPDNKLLHLGDANDLRLWHSGSASYLDNYTNQLYIRSQSNGNDIHLQVKDNAGVSNQAISVYGSEKRVTLRYNNLTRLNTTDEGIYVNGDIHVSGNYKSSDGTPGYNGSFIAGAYDITVKDGLITNVVNIS